MNLSNVGKICILTSVHNAFDIRIFQKEAKTLKKAGYDVTLIAQHDSKEIVGGIWIIPLSKPKNRFERLTKTLWAVYREALKIDADVYHLHDPELIPVGLMLRILRKKKIIYDMHENLPKQIKNKHWINSYLRNPISFFANFAEKFLLIDVPIIFAEISYQQDYQWVKKYATILNMPLEYDLLRIKEESPKSEKVLIGYIGALSEERGSLTTIEMFRILKNRGIELKFECIGGADKHHRKQLIKLCEKYKLSNICFHWQLPTRRGWSILAQCHIGLAVLHPIPNYIESYPTKIFEYMALGLPVIASDFPLIREIVEKVGCGLLVNPLDPDEIANAVIYLLNNPDKALEMAKNGLMAVHDRYNWQIEEKKFLKFYEEIFQMM